MQKEIFEQPDSVVNTMRGRVQFNQYEGEMACVCVGELLGTFVSLPEVAISILGILCRFSS